MATNLAQAEHKAQLRFNWREWAVLTIMGTLAALTLIPALWSQSQQIAQAQSVSPLALLLKQVIQSAIQLGLVVGIGLFSLTALAWVRPSSKTGWPERKSARR